METLLSLETLHVTLNAATKNTAITGNTVDTAVTDQNTVVTETLTTEAGTSV